MDKAETIAEKWNRLFWPGVPVIITKSDREGNIKSNTSGNAYILESSDSKLYPYVDCEGFGQCDLSRVQVDHTIDYSPWLKSQNSKPPVDMGVHQGKDRARKEIVLLLAFAVFISTIISKFF